MKTTQIVPKRSSFRKVIFYLALQRSPTLHLGLGSLSRVEDRVLAAPALRYDSAAGAIGMPRIETQSLCPVGQVSLLAVASTCTPRHAAPPVPLGDALAHRSALFPSFLFHCCVRFRREVCVGVCVCVCYKERNRTDSLPFPAKLDCRRQHASSAAWRGGDWSDGTSRGCPRDNRRTSERHPKDGRSRPFSLSVPES